MVLVAEEMDRAGPAWRQHPDSIVAELSDIGQRLTNLYDALETRKLSLDDLAPRIQSLRQRQEQLTAARLDVEDQMQAGKREMLDLEDGKRIRGRPQDSPGPGHPRRAQGSY